MDAKRWILLTRKRSRLIHAVALGLILTRGILLVPRVHATGDAQTNLVAGAKTASDSGWSSSGTGVNGEVRAIAVSGTDVYVGGGFSNADGVVHTNGIAKYSAASVKVYLPLVLRAS